MSGWLRKSATTQSSDGACSEDGKRSDARQRRKGWSVQYHGRQLADSNAAELPASKRRRRVRPVKWAGASDDDSDNDTVSKTSCRIPDPVILSTAPDRGDSIAPRLIDRLSRASSARMVKRTETTIRGVPAGSALGWSVREQHIIAATTNSILLPAVASESTAAKMVVDVAPNAFAEEVQFEEPANNTFLGDGSVIADTSSQSQAETTPIWAVSSPKWDAPETSESQTTTAETEAPRPPDLASFVVDEKSIAASRCLSSAAALDGLTDRVHIAEHCEDSPHNDASNQWLNSDASSYLERGQAILEFCVGGGLPVPHETQVTSGPQSINGNPEAPIQPSSVSCVSELQNNSAPMMFASSTTSESECDEACAAQKMVEITGDSFEGDHLEDVANDALSTDEGVLAHMPPESQCDTPPTAEPIFQQFFPDASTSSAVSHNAPDELGLQATPGEPESPAGPDSATFMSDQHGTMVMDGVSRTAAELVGCAESPSLEEELCGEPAHHATTGEGLGANISRLSRKAATLALGIHAGCGFPAPHEVPVASESQAMLGTLEAPACPGITPCVAEQRKENSLDLSAGAASPWTRHAQAAVGPQTIAAGVRCPSKVPLTERQEMDACSALLSTSETSPLNELAASRFDGFMAGSGASAEAELHEESASDSFLQDERPSADASPACQGHVMPMGPPQTFGPQAGKSSRLDKAVTRSSASAVSVVLPDAPSSARFIAPEASSMQHPTSLKMDVSLLVPAGSVKQRQMVTVERSCSSLIVPAFLGTLMSTTAQTLPEAPEVARARQRAARARLREETVRQESMSKSLSCDGHVGPNRDGGTPSNAALPAGKESVDSGLSKGVGAQLSQTSPRKSKSYKRLCEFGSKNLELQVMPGGVDVD
eukprot:TRINITY_DN102779_c0_g1_i1.p1 TRINITY_DN102779_c0_g1~~TRINITY_DN102779_c0_g1_i1.p1  ORF type:complete len:887 (+),score=125.23 TRINITY_DN102779_c0_g1_i1:296-2956(+)